MQLHQLSRTKRKTKKRIGRGGKRGTYSGRGIKGQKSRAGRRIRPAERDLIMRIPKKRGFKNKPKGPKPAVFNLKDLSIILKNMKGKQPFLLNKASFKKAGLLPSRFRGDVKLLGVGVIDTAVNIEGIKVSKSAIEKLKKAGGRVAAEKLNKGK